MESYLITDLYDLVTPDGKIVSIEGHMATVVIENISPAFVGFLIDPKQVFFNIKSTLAQLGVNGIGKEYHLDRANLRAEVQVELRAYGTLGEAMCKLLVPGTYIGKLFAADERRKVRDPDYLFKTAGRMDRNGKPLLLFGKGEMRIEKVEGRTVAYLPLKKGYLGYQPEMLGFLPFLAKALMHPKISTRQLLKLGQKEETHPPGKGGITLVRTEPLYVRTVFAKVVNELLPKNISHTSASVLEPTTQASGDIYELFGSSEEPLTEIPIEFYTLEPHREYIYFADRDQLQASLKNFDTLYKTLKNAPDGNCAVFVVKGNQLLELEPKDWIVRHPHFYDFPGTQNPDTQALLAEKYIEEQPTYPYLKAIEEELITSQGVLLCKYLPSPLMKKIISSTRVQEKLKGIYFLYPSHAYGNFFSHEDRSFLLDLAKFGIPTFWIDETSQKILQYTPKPGKDSGMFVPLDKVETFLKATTFGIYGSSLLTVDFAPEVKKLLQGILKMRSEVNHLLLNKDTPITLVSGGGPGVMSLGNQIAKELGILSCANIAEFKTSHEQTSNPYIDAKMTYRIDRLIERQAEFHLDFPIFLLGGIGTDFEYALEEVRRKTGSSAPNPVLLFGPTQYWKEKITSRFQCNLASGTIAGAEWTSNCFFSIQTADQGLDIYRRFLSGTLPIGKSGPIYKDGFKY